MDTGLDTRTDTGLDTGTNKGTVTDVDIENVIAEKQC